MISRGPRTQCQMLECLESHSFSAALSPAPPFGGGGRGGEEAGGRGTLERPRHGRRGQEKGMWLWVSRQAGFSGEAQDWGLGVAAPDYLK